MKSTWNDIKPSGGVMKIGLEYEGVIKREGIAIRWNDLPIDLRARIQGINTIAPVDRYDCLAEVRFLEQNELTSRNLLYDLFTHIIFLSEKFRKEGLSIEWKENDISQDLHDRIVKDFGQDKKSKKITYTLGNQGLQVWQPGVIDKRRGGGLHINVSGLPKNSWLNWVMDMHEGLRDFKNSQMRSHYRNRILFRKRYIGTEEVFEYMSFGFELPLDSDKLSFKEFFEITKHHFHWAEAVLRISERIERGL